jgi:hypothetical protein
MVSFEREKAEVREWKLEIRKKLRHKSAEKMEFEWFCGEKLEAGGWKEKKRKG